MMPQKSILRKITLYSLLGLLVGPMGWADSVRLKDQANPINGHVVSVSETQVVLKTKDGNQLPLNRASVQDIQFDTGLQKLASAGSFFHREPSGVYFPEEDGSIDDKLFVTLSKFKGKSSQRTYAGLYHFSDKGTFWIRLPKPQNKSSDLQFALYGKQNGQQEVERYSLKARFLDEYGNTLEDSPSVTFDKKRAEVVEWFQLLDGISGLAGKKDVSWRVPEGTKTIEFKVLSSEAEISHLVGYLGNLSLVSPE